MSYGNDGSCCNGGGWGFPFMGNMGGFGMGMGYEWLLFILFFGMFGWGGNGFGFGGRGLEQATTTAAETASLVGQQQTADRVAGIATGVDAVAGIATANGVKIEQSKDLTSSGFANLNTHLCEGFHSVSQQFNAQTMQGMNMHNATTALLNDMRAEQARYGCESKTLAQAIASQQQYQYETGKSEILRAIADSECRIMSRMDAAEKAALQEKLAQANSIIAAQKAEADNAKQTATLAALIQQQNGGGCCAPTNCCGVQNPCTILTNALYTDWVNKTLNPTTTTAA